MLVSGKPVLVTDAMRYSLFPHLKLLNTDHLFNSFNVFKPYIFLKMVFFLSEKHIFRERRRDTLTEKVIETSITSSLPKMATAARARSVRSQEPGAFF